MENFRPLLYFFLLPFQNLPVPLSFLHISRILFLQVLPTLVFLPFLLLLQPFFPNFLFLPFNHQILLVLLLFSPPTFLNMVHEMVCFSGSWVFETVVVTFANVFVVGKFEIFLLYVVFLLQVVPQITNLIFDFPIFYLE